MTRKKMPSTQMMYDALLRRDTEYDGVFVVGVSTTGVFCRPTCPARKPKRENVRFYKTTAEAIAAGFRPCKRCRPLQPAGATPDWIRALLETIDEDPSRRFTDADLREASIDPIRVRRWFKSTHGMTFHAYQRARRLARAHGQLREGDDMTRTAYDHGFESLSGFRDAFSKLFGETPGRGKDKECVIMTRYLTPLGPMIAGATNEGVCILEFVDRRMLDTQIERLRSHLDCVFAPGEHEHLRRLERELKDYFDGELETFNTPVVLRGTEFQCAVWKRLLEIPYGETLSYERLARDIGRPGAQRAVGRANGDNRLAIIVPCHRVIRSDGQLCGYGGGLWRKQRLLELESAGESLFDLSKLPQNFATR